MLGAREQIDALRTIICADVVSDLPRYGNAAALATTMVVALISFIALQRWISSRRNFSGPSAAPLPIQALGRWKWITFAAIAALLFVIALPPEERWREGQSVAMHIAPQRLHVWPDPTAMESAIEVIERPLAKAA